MQERTSSRIMIDFDPADRATPPQQFAVIRETWAEARRSDRENWYQQGSRRRDVLATASRGVLARLIAEGADVLAYLGDDFQPESPAEGGS